MRTNQSTSKIKDNRIWKKPNKKGDDDSDFSYDDHSTFGVPGKSMIITK